MVKSNENLKVGRKSYTIAFRRLAILHFDKTNSKNKTIKQLGIKSRSTLRKWISEKELLFDPFQRAKSRKIVSLKKQRSSYFPDSEQRVFEWYSSLKDENKKVESRSLQVKMRDDVLKNHDQVNKVLNIAKLFPFL